MFQRLRNCCRYKLNKSYIICSKLKSIIPFYYSQLRSKPFHMQKSDRLFLLHLVLLTFYFRNSLKCCTVSTDFLTMILSKNLYGFFSLHEKHPMRIRTRCKINGNEILELVFMILPTASNHFKKCNSI